METAKHQWAELDGYAVAHNLGYLQDMPLSRFANFVWYMLTKDGDAAQVDSLKRKLWMPERGTIVTDPRSPWYSGNEAQNLAQFKRSLAK